MYIRDWYLCVPLRLCRHQARHQHHDDGRRLSFHGPGHRGFESGRDRAYHSHVQDGRPFEENNRRGHDVEGSKIDDEGSGHADCMVRGHVHHAGHHGRSRNARMQRVVYEPTLDILRLI